MMCAKHSQLDPCKCCELEDMLSGADEKIAELELELGSCRASYHKLMYKFDARCKTIEEMTKLYQNTKERP